MGNVKRTDATRDRILKRAGQLFYGEGINAVGVDRISELTPVSKRTLYLRFGSKDQLVSEYLAATGAATLADLLSAADEDISPAERMLSVFVVQRAQSLQAGFRGCPMVNASVELTDPDHAGRVIALDYKLRLQSFFAEQASLGGANDPDLLAEQLVMIFDGGMAYALVRNAAVPESVQATARALVELQMTGAGAAT